MGKDTYPLKALMNYDLLARETITQFKLWLIINVSLYSILKFESNQNCDRTYIINQVKTFTEGLLIYICVVTRRILIDRIDNVVYYVVLQIKLPKA